MAANVTELCLVLQRDAATYRVQGGHELSIDEVERLIRHYGLEFNSTARRAELRPRVASDDLPYKVHSNRGARHDARRNQAVSRLRRRARRRRK